MKRNILSTALLALVIFGAASLTVAQASIPNLINFQGRLNDSIGNPVPDGSHNFIFRIFPAPTSGNALWTEGPLSIPTSGGLFNHQLGSNTVLPQALFVDSTQLYLEIEVEGEVQSPRVHLISIPYARVANDLKDEPGVAGNTFNAGPVLNGTVQTLLSRSITVPAPGYVLAIATTTVVVNHTNGIISDAAFGVSKTAAGFPPTQNGGVFIDETWPTGFFDNVIGVHGLFPVGAGTSTFYFLGQEVSGDFSVIDGQLSLLYVPNAYGVVAPQLIGGGQSDVNEKVKKISNLTSSGVTTELTEPEVFKAVRLVQELSDLKARIEKLEKKEQKNSQAKN